MGTITSIDVCPDLTPCFPCDSNHEISALFTKLLPKQSIFSKLDPDSNSIIALILYVLIKLVIFKINNVRPLLLCPKSSPNLNQICVRIEFLFVVMYHSSVQSVDLKLIKRWIIFLSSSTLYSLQWRQIYIVLLISHCLLPVE